jgi:hypothetical protein
LPFRINFEIMNRVESSQDFLDGGSDSRKGTIDTRRHKHREREQDNQASSGIRTHDPTVWAGEWSTFSH